MFEVNILLDSGASTSVMSVAGINAKESLSGKTTSVVKGIGGSSRTGSAMNCIITFNVIPDKVFNCLLKPMAIEGESNLVILGRDFMSQLGVTQFDWINNSIMLGLDWVYTLSEETSDYNVSDQLNTEEGKSLLEVIEKYKDVFAHDPKCPNETTASYHTILAKDDRIIKDRIRRLPEKHAITVENQVNEMLRNGIIQESCSPYNSNILLVDKKDGSKRFCIDFRLLNKNTIKDSYPLPNIDEMIDRCHGCVYFSQLDLASGYWSIPVREEDRQKLAFSVPKGKYEFVRMPFGLVNAQATFQRTMDRVVTAVKDQGFPGVDAYVDNIIIFSHNWAEHIETLELVLETLRSFNMSLRTDKCEFASEKLDILGYSLGKDGITASEENVQKVKDFPPPNTRKKLQRFLGLVNFNRRFIKNYAEITAPLAEMTSTKVKFCWGKEQAKSFDAIKLCLYNAPLLKLPDWSKPFQIQCDASDIAVGAVLFQTHDGVDTPLAYHSKTLTKGEKQWSATDKELFAIISASRKWRSYCSTKVVFYTDHQPLKYISLQKDPRPKLARWLLELENIDFSIEYVKGSENATADYLSRIETSESGNQDRSDENIYTIEAHTLDCDLIKKHQEADPTIAAVVTMLKASGDISAGPFKGYRTLAISEGLLTKSGRVVIPGSLSKRIIQEYHGQHHYGAENTMLLLKNRFYWKKMDKEIKDFVADCRTCVQCKHTANPKAELVIDETIPGVMERVAIDIATMPKSAQGNQYFLLMVDIGSGYCVTAPMINQKAATIEATFKAYWMAYFGAPKELLSDQGRNVDGNVIKNLCEMYDIKKLRSSPYHPEGNGMAERSIGSIKTLLRLCVRLVKYLSINGTP